MILEIEKAILAKVKSLAGFDSTYVKDFPDKPGKLQAIVPNGQILIGYQKSAYSVLSETSPVTIERNLQFEVSFQLKELRSHTGIYSTIDAVFFGLLGFIPVQGIGNGMYPAGESFVNVAESIYYYSQSWVVPTVVTEGEDPFIPIDDNPLDINQLRIGLWVSKIDRVADPANSQLDRQILIEEP